MKTREVEEAGQRGTSKSEISRTALWRDTMSMKEWKRSTNDWEDYQQARGREHNKIVENENNEE